MAILEELAKVQELVAAEVAGDKESHTKLLKAIHSLMLAAETPLETTSRLNFQVCVTGSPLHDLALGGDPL